MTAGPAGARGGATANAQPCPACRIRNDYIVAEAQLPPTLPLLSQRPGTRLASWLDGQSLRWCSACGRIYQLWFDAHDQYFELVELPAELLGLLEDRGSVDAAARLLSGRRFVLDWVSKWLDAARYDLQAAIDALCRAATAPEATPERIEALVRAWQAVCNRARREARRIDAHRDILAAAAERTDVFRKAGDAYVQERIAALLPTRNGRANQAPSGDPLDLLAALDAPPGAADAARVQRALLKMRELVQVPGKTTPPERAAKLVAAFRATSAWADATTPGTFEAMVARDIRELLDVVYREHRLPSGLNREAAALIDRGGFACVAAAQRCQLPEKRMAAPHCAHCAAVVEDDTARARKLARVFQAGWAEAAPPFVGGSWVVSLDKEWIGACPKCDSFYWIRETGNTADIQAVRLPPAARALLASPLNLKAVIELLAGADYHAHRLTGLRELAWRLVSEGYGYFPPQALLDALLDLAVRPGLCGDVVVDVAELIGRLLTETARRIGEGSLPPERTLLLPADDARLTVLRNAPLAHLTAEAAADARREILSRACGR